MYILSSSGKFCCAAGGSQSSGSACITFTKPLKGKFLLPRSLGTSLSHPGGSVLPVLLLVDFSEPGLVKHPVMIIPCHSQQLAVNHMDLIPEQILPGHLLTQSSAPVPGRGQEAPRAAEKLFLVPFSPVSSGTRGAAAGREAKELWVFSLGTWKC